MPLSIGDGADRVGEAEILQPAEGGAALRLEQRVVHPGLRVLGVDRLGDDVVVAGQHQRFLERQPRLGPALQPLHPGSL